MAKIHNKTLNKIKKIKYNLIQNINKKYNSL